MIDRICLLLEALSVVICLHHLYGEKFRLDIATISLLVIDMIMMTTIDYFGWSSTLSIFIYPLIALYCGIKFGFEWKKIIINNILYIIIISSVQVVLMLLFYQCFDMQAYGHIGLLAINSVIFILVGLLFGKFRLNKLSIYLQNKERIMVISLGLCIIIIVVCLANYKNIKTFELYQYVLLSTSVLVMCVLVMYIGKYKIRAKEVETELKMHELYADSFKALIENIRMRQHEFDNHISTIYSQHLLCDTYEGLVGMQRDYCKNLEKENRYNKLLKYDNHIIRGFLYVKFLEVEKHGIEVSYEIVLDKLDVRMPVYKLVEILGDLINNAVEAMEETEVEKKLHVSIIEVEEKVEIEIRNTSKYISHDEISRFFEKGYSKKGAGRGLGLYNVKKICDDYEFKILCENKEMKNQNWIVFIISGKR